MKAPIVTVVARTGGEPELRFLNDGTGVCSVRGVWSQDKPDGVGGWLKEHETWLTIEWWGKAAEHTADLAIESGALIRVTGMLYMDSYTRRDGTPGQTLKLRADGTPKAWPKRDRDQQPTGTGRAGQAAPPAPAAGATTQGGAQPAELGYGAGGARHDDPPF
ncbi:single-stranded DNA-binding protein [Brachybacterium sp.]|uniref:single-stranded DNA-binding protein n=1 Tax=Brachybacterium sp. TaxID=1891286 RepID=UPI002ED63EAA